MNDPALYGNCLSCGARCYGQSYCDSCSEDETYECADCGGDGFEREYNNCFEHEIDELKDTIAYLKRGWEIKDARIHNLEQLVELYQTLDEIRRINLWMLCDLDPEVAMEYLRRKLC